jgi:hypothetical protein
VSPHVEASAGAALAGVITCPAISSTASKAKAILFIGQLLYTLKVLEMVRVENKYIYIISTNYILAIKISINVSNSSLFSSKKTDSLS